MIAWEKATQKDVEQIGKVIDRAKKIWPDLNTANLDMDLTAVHVSGCPLDFEKLLAFDEQDFLHDISGITIHIDRTTGELQNCFFPRCHA